MAEAPYARSCQLLLRGAVISTATLALCALLEIPPAAADGTAPSDFDRLIREDDVTRFGIIDEKGVWFTTPLGVDCAMKDDGSYGCAGPLPGVSDPTAAVGWLPGNISPRQYPLSDMQFGSGRRQALLIRDHYVQYRGSRCAVTVDSGVYCRHGDDLDSQILITTEATLMGRDLL